MSETGNKMPFWQRRAFAGLVLAAAVLVGVFGIGGAKLKGAGKQADAYFEKNMASDYALRVSAAEAIVQQGESVLAADDAMLAAARTAVDAASAAESSAAQWNANTALTAPVGQLYELLRKSMSADKGSVLQTTWAEFNSRQNILSHAYEEYAPLREKADEAKAGFPATLIARVTG